MVLSSGILNKRTIMSESIAAIKIILMCSVFYKHIQMLPRGNKKRTDIFQLLSSFSNKIILLCGLNYFAWKLKFFSFDKFLFTSIIFLEHKSFFVFWLISCTLNLLVMMIKSSLMHEHYFIHPHLWITIHVSFPFVLKRPP